MRLVARMVAFLVMLSLLLVVVATLLSQKPGSDPLQAPTPWYKPSPADTGPVPCDWCSQMTSSPAPKGGASPTPRPF